MTLIFKENGMSKRNSRLVDTMWTPMKKVFMKKIQEGKVPQWLQKRLFKAYGAMYDEYDKKEYSSN